MPRNKNHPLFLNEITGVSLSSPTPARVLPPWPYMSTTRWRRLREHCTRTWRQAHALSQPANDLTAPRAAILAATFGPGKVCVLFFIFKNMEQITWSQHQSLSAVLLVLNSPTSSEIFGFRAIFCNGFICKDLSIYVTIIIACRDDKRSLSWFAISHNLESDVFLYLLCRVPMPMK